MTWSLQEDLFFTEQRNSVSNLISDSKTEFYRVKIQDCNGDQNELMNVINIIQQKKKESPLAPHDSDKELAEGFSKFYISKIDTIRSGIESLPEPTIIPSIKRRKPDPPSLSEFTSLSQDNVAALIKKMPTKSCALDPIPTNLLKYCVPELLPVITEIVNSSLRTPRVPEDMKHAIIKPLLKKPNLDLIYKNFRPVSNLSFVAKLTEKAVATQLCAHMNQHNLFDKYQSAYREKHSTETAVLKVQNDILISMDQGQIVVLVLLNLSAAFDTVDHTILLQRLQDYSGVTGEALLWFKSYLENRRQYVI